ncbi:hypothetical protein D1O30_15335 [Methylocystis hirsuta]|uniref:Uncharacterized protein n=1 Tax=Methylocystis hirsuta TaxID=369798 RepID=A0A3M9XSD6_9HYPH|nr:hypothetical protein D1O30_15335 [Methylocystis hirsuta]
MLRAGNVDMLNCKLAQGANRQRRRRASIENRWAAKQRPSPPKRFSYRRRDGPFDRSAARIMQLRRWR